MYGALESVTVLWRPGNDQDIIIIIIIVNTEIQITPAPTSVQLDCVKPAGHARSCVENTSADAHKPPSKHNTIPSHKTGWVKNGNEWANEGTKCVKLHREMDDRWAIFCWSFTNKLHSNQHHFKNDQTQFMICFHIKHSKTDSSFSRWLTDNQCHFRHFTDYNYTYINSMKWLYDRTVHHRKVDYC